MLKKAAYLLVFTIFISLWSSCRKDFEYKESTGNLTFSKDTVYLDTVFSNIGSSTYNLKVYNNSDDDIIIPSIKLQKEYNSAFRLNVDGNYKGVASAEDQYGKVFENVELLANDSLFIFIETTIDISNETNQVEYLYTDKIEFDAGDKRQEIDLVSLVKDAVLIYPNRDADKVVETLTLNINGNRVLTDIQGRYLNDNELNFTNTKPYVIYGFAAVPNNNTLTIDAGARLHFHENSGLIITEGASLKVNGKFSQDQDKLENEVIFEGDRLEPIYENVPGQWGTIWLSENSINNTISYATIKNATIGILADANANEANNKLNINNTKIYNSSNYGILGRNTSIKADNVVINNSGQVSFAGTLGGKYNFTHCTIANYWNSGFRQLPALLINNFVLDEDNNAFLADLTEANFNNCIIYGNDNPEFLVDEIEDDNVAFNFKFTNCLLRFSDPNNTLSGANYDFNDTNTYENNIFNKEPNFIAPFENNLIITENSAAINTANSTFANQVPFDVLNVSRTSAPDIGAYQHVIIEE